MIVLQGPIAGKWHIFHLLLIFLFILPLVWSVQACSMLSRVIVCLSEWKLIGGALHYIQYMMLWIYESTYKFNIYSLSIPARHTVYIY